jgi:Flp pilus assembly protein TadD
MPPIARAVIRVLQLLAALAVLGQGALLVFRPDPLDELRQADGLFARGRYHDARAAYAAIALREPGDAITHTRLGMVMAVRSELPAASRHLGYAVGLGLDERTLELVRLYQGRIAELAGQPEEATRFWALVPDSSPLGPLRRTLEAEALLRAGSYSTAETGYRAALAPALPGRWRAVVHTRLATLRATADLAAAHAELARAHQPALPASLAPSFAALADPLLPPPSPDPQQLAAALAAMPAERSQLLGQLFLAARLYPLAERQFAVAGTHQTASAAAYAAYTRWSSGDRAGGLRALEALVAEHPDEPRARTLLAVAYLAAHDEAEASAQIAVARALSPHDPDVHLATGELLVLRRDYPAAADEYARALQLAAPEHRGMYALAMARFHAATSLHQCEAGRPAAALAAQLLPTDNAAWSALAAAQLACGEPSAAVAAAREAVRLAPASPEAAYHLGRALAALGERDAAREALVAAADLAPASEWRARAERQLEALGL